MKRVDSLTPGLARQTVHLLENRAYPSSLSLVMPMYNEEKIVALLRAELEKFLPQLHCEAEVLLGISRGKPNRDIGEILNISPRTVNKHLEQIFVKLGVENRAAAAAAAVRTLTG